MERRVVPFKTRPTAFREDIKIIFARFSAACLHNGGLVTICRWLYTLSFSESR